VVHFSKSRKNSPATKQREGEGKFCHLSKLKRAKERILNLLFATKEIQAKTGTMDKL
jgi:hypothetical protein